MPIRAHLPAQLAERPFRGSTAIASGLLTTSMLRGRSWQRLLPDVYLHRDVPLDHRMWCTAVALTLPSGAAIGGLSAAYLWGVDLLRTRSPVSVVAPRARWIRPNNWITVHYTVFGPEDVTSLDGLHVTTPERTAFDLGRRLRRQDAVVALDAIFHQDDSRVEAVCQLARQRHWWPRVQQLNEVLRLADPRAESPMESLLRLLLMEEGVSAPVPQFEVRDEDGRLIGRVDLAWPARQVALEYEGDHHRERNQFRRDIDRLNALRMAGWTVLRVTADDVLRRPRETVAMVAAELARHH